MTGLVVWTNNAMAWTLVSRELVDMQFAADDALIVLVSAPGATAPGLYRWPRGAAAAKQLCTIESPASFSFDRKLIIERVGRVNSLLRLYNANDCRVIAEIDIDGTVADADVHGNDVALAVRLPDSQYELRLLTKRKRGYAVLAVQPASRNLELGFAPDGKTLLNFDLSDRGSGGTASSLAWRLPTLKALELPAWAVDGQTTFVAGSRLIARYLGNTLAVARWPSGKLIHSVPASTSVRIRQLSGDGRFAVVHERINGADALGWIDFATAKRVPMAQGSIDHAAISATGQALAWSMRSADSMDQISVQRTRIAPDAAVSVIEE